MRWGAGPVEDFAAAVDAGDEAAASPRAQGDPHRRRLCTDSPTPGSGAIKRLLALGVDVNAVDDAGATALHFAAGHGHPDCVAALVEAHADLDLRDRQHASSPVLWARNFGHTEIIEMLLASGARLNAADAAKLGLDNVVAGFLEDVPASIDRAVGWPTPWPVRSPAVIRTPSSCCWSAVPIECADRIGDTPLDSLRWVEEGKRRDRIEALLHEHGAQ